MSSTARAATALLAAFLSGNWVPCPAAENPVGSVRQALDIPYVEGGGERQRLDLFRPEGAEGRPVVLVVHGGAWTFGDKDFYGLYRDVAVGLARQGLVVASANYRLAPWTKHPEQVRDVARAFAWLRCHAREHGGDPDSIFLCGHSAGGHLVSLLATNPSVLRDVGLGDRDRQALKGVVSVSGVYTIPESEDVSRVVEGMLAGPKAADNPRGERMPAGSLLGRAAMALNPFPLVFGTDPRKQAEASPLRQVRSGLAPFLLLYASDDLPLLPEMARDFEKALRDAGNPVELLKQEGRNHNSIFFRADSGDDAVNRAILDFIRRHRS